MSKIIFSIVMFFALFGCKQSPTNKVNPNGDNLAWLIGKEVHVVDSIIYDRKTKKSVVFLFNYYDCETCVDAGFCIVKKIDELSKRRMCYPIGSMLNPSSYQQRNKYYEYIYMDDKDLIRKELKYIPTPVLLLIDGDNLIQDALFPTDTLGGSYKEFLLSCLRSE